VVGPLSPSVRVLPDAGAAARAVAERLRAIAAEATRRSGRCRVAISGGRTPGPMFDALAATPGGAAAWSAWQLYWCDERIVAPEDPRSNFGLARQRWLAPARFPEANVHRIPTDSTAERAAEAYERTLRAHFPSGKAPTFDAVVLGMGPDGHTASLFPGSPNLDVVDRWVVAEPRPGQPPPVPRVTLTLEGLARARVAVFLVAGADKRAALARVLGAAGTPAGPRLPAARVRAVESVEWFVDRDAADGASFRPSTGEGPRSPAVS
jgi:6-phosphogluconolactonase